MAQSAPPLTFRILSLLRYVIDIGKSSPNPILLGIQWNWQTESLPKIKKSFFVLLDRLWNFAINHYIGAKKKNLAYWMMNFEVSVAFVSKK